MSDGWLEKYSSVSNTRFRFKQSITRADYVIHSFMTLSHYCSSLPNIVKSERRGNIHYGLILSTRLLPCFNELYDLFYKNKVKVVSNNIYDLLTPIALVHWIMGDEAILNKGLVLCTDSFTLQKVVLLMNVLRIKYDINSTIQGFNKGKPRIYILPESMLKLRNLVKLHMLSSMWYKLNEST